MLFNAFSMLFNAFPGASGAACQCTPVRVAGAHGLRNVPEPFWNLDFAAFEHQNARTASLDAHFGSQVCGRGPCSVTSNQRSDWERSYQRSDHELTRLEALRP